MDNLSCIGVCTFTVAAVAVIFTAGSLPGQHRLQNQQRLAHFKSDKMLIKGHPNLSMSHYSGSNGDDSVNQLKYSKLSCKASYNNYNEFHQIAAENQKRYGL